MTRERHPTPAVGAAIVRDGAVLVVKRGRGAHAGSWAVPGGRQRFGETGREAVVREVREETGLDVEPGAIVWVGDIIDPGSPSTFHYSVVDYAATIVGGTLRAGDDAAAVAWMPLHEADSWQLTPTMPALLEQLGA